ncbi:hypothetical protein K3495_g11288 [Podosphaera aphanis]|nr:hypothetical protein K3495_g11288 [Podosphaera aphanis]
MRYIVPTTALAALFLSVTQVHGRVHQVLRQHSLDVLKERDNSKDLSDILKNADKVTFVSITPDENNPIGLMNAIKNYMPGVSHVLLDTLGNILGGGQEKGSTTTTTVTQFASPTPAKANVASGQALSATAVSGQGLARTAAANQGTAAAKQTGDLNSMANSSSLAPPNLASAPAATGGASSGVQSSPFMGSKCACSCLCGTGPMPNGAGMNGASSASATSDLMVNGSGSLLPNGECACSCVCPPGSFPGSGNMPAIMGQSGGSKPEVAGQTAPSPIPSQPQAAQEPASQPQAAQEPDPQPPAVQEPAPQKSNPTTSIAQPASPSGDSVFNLPLVAGATTPPESVPTPQTPQPAQNPDPINIDSYKLSSSLLLGLSQPTPAP